MLLLLLCSPHQSSLLLEISLVFCWVRTDFSPKIHFLHQYQHLSHNLELSESTPTPLLYLSFLKGQLHIAISAIVHELIFGARTHNTISYSYNTFFSRNKIFHDWHSATLRLITHSFSAFGHKNILGPAYIFAFSFQLCQLSDPMVFLQVIT